MDKATAATLVKFYAASDNEPTLTEGEIEIILSQALRVDSAGASVGDTGYVSNYDANYAVRMAWIAKAGKAAGKYTFLAGGNQFIRSDMIRHCQQMADEWSRGMHSCAPIGSQTYTDYALLLAAQRGLSWSLRG